MGNDPKTVNVCVYVGKVNDFNVAKIDKLVKRDRQGYILEVDVEYLKIQKSYPKSQKNCYS